MGSVLYHPSDGESGSPVSLCDALGSALHTGGWRGLLVLGHPAGTDSQLTAHLHLPSVFRVAVSQGRVLT